jgi:hypothetical protein
MLGDECAFGADALSAVLGSGAFSFGHSDAQRIGRGRDFPVGGDELVVFQPGKSRALPGLVV